MQRLRLCAVCSLVIALSGCKGKPEETFTEVKNGAFKVVIRSQEFHHSSIRNIDICVENSSNSGFANKRDQCFLHGFDFDGLTVKWQGPQVIEVAFRSGRVSYFTNSAVAYPGGPVPVEFQILLCDGREADSR